jgi:hypothetical protein
MHTVRYIVRYTDARERPQVLKTFDARSALLRARANADHGPVKLIRIPIAR